MKCIDCGVARGKHHDPRQPSYANRENGERLCFPCWEAAVDERCDELRDELSELLAEKKRFAAAARRRGGK